MNPPRPDHRLGFPDFFMMYGPNTNLGHNSIIFMIECQAGYIRKCIQALQQRELASVDVKPQVMEAFDDALPTELSRTVWACTEARWYDNDFRPRSGASAAERT